MMKIRGIIIKAIGNPKLNQESLPWMTMRIKNEGTPMQCAKLKN
jgi:hypothetical protein